MTTGVVMLDFGGPQSAEELVPFLTELLQDVLPGPMWLRRIVAPRVASARSKRVQPDYERIGWSPVVPTHHRQVEALRLLIDPALPIASGMLFTPPTMDDAVAHLKAQGVERIVAVPMFPHFSFATTGAAFNFLYQAMERAGCADMPVRWVPAYPEHPDYIAALVETIRAGLAATPGPVDEPIHLLFTPHGLPVSFVDRGDPYPEQIRASVRATVRALEWEGPYRVGWQSRLGPVQWLTPSTPEVLDQLAAEGCKRVCLVPISFASEHVETLQEIDVEYRDHALHAGIPHFGRAPALGSEPRFIEALADLVTHAVASLDRYSCVRCLMPKPEAHRRRKQCPSCHYKFPGWAQHGVTTP